MAGEGDDRRDGGTRIRLPFLFLAGTFYVGLGSPRIVVAENAAGQRVLYLVVAARLAMDYDGVVAITYLIDGVLCRLLCVLTHLILPDLGQNHLAFDPLLLRHSPSSLDHRFRR